jgi:hypothetical protein
MGMTTSAAKRTTVSVATLDSLRAGIANESGFPKVFTGMAETRRQLRTDPMKRLIPLAALACFLASRGAFAAETEVLHFELNPDWS